MSVFFVSDVLVYRRPSLILCIIKDRQKGYQLKLTPMPGARCPGTIGRMINELGLSL